MTATSTTKTTTDDDEPHTIDHEPDGPTGGTPGRATVTLSLDETEARALIRVAELGLVVFGVATPPADLAQRILAEFNAYSTGPIEAPDRDR